MATNLAEVKEQIAKILEELTEEERRELSAFVQDVLYPKTVERMMGFWDDIPGETEEELDARIEAYMRDLDQIASDAPSDIVEDLREIRQGLVR
jgi:hypothetical protein